MKKYIRELGAEELIKVFDANSKLRDDVFNDMIENADFWLDDYLSAWENGSVKYEICACAYSYFRAEDNRLFIDGLKIAQQTFCLLPEATNATIDYVDTLLSKRDALPDYGPNYDRITARIDEIIEQLEKEVLSRLLSEYEDCYKEEYQREYFLDFYADARLDDDLYIDENYILYEHVEYTRSFAS